MGSKDFIEKYNNEIISDRGMELDCQILEVILGLKDVCTLSEITMKKIEDILNFGLENPKEKISAKKIGWYVHSRLKLKTERGRNGYYILENK